MATKRTTGTAQVGTAVDADLWAEWKTWVDARGETQRFALEQAMRRHMAYPPSPPVPPPVEPLPDATGEASPAPAARRRGRPRKGT